MLRRVVLVSALVLLGAAAATAAPAPSPELRIAGAVLRAADVNGAKVTEQGYERDPVALAWYSRDFDDVTYGQTRFSYVESSVSLYRTSLDAGLALAGHQAVFNPTNASLAALASAFGRATTLAPSSVVVRRKQPLELPQTQGSEIVLRLTTPAGKVEGGYVFLQTGRLVGVLVTMTQPGSTIARADLARLYGTFAKRMRSEAKRFDS